MPHVDQRTLDLVLNHQLPVTELRRIKAHVETCRPCARMLEEWRDLFGEVEAVIPTVERSAEAAEPRHSGIRILFPLSPALLRWRVDSAKLLLGVGAALATTVALLALRPGRESLPAIIQVTAPKAPPVAGAPVVPRSAPPSTGPSSQTNAGSGSPVSRLAHPTVAAPPQPVDPPVALSPAAEARPFTETVRTPVPTAASTGFKRVDMTEAVRRLQGSIRLIDGMTPDHIEVGPGRAVPGAEPALDVVRVVYLTPEGARVFLDQQRTGKAAEEPAIDSAPSGIALARWTDEHGFWLSLAGLVNPGTMHSLVKRVR